MSGKSFWSRLFGGGGSAGSASGERLASISNRDLLDALKAAQSDPSQILEARQCIEQLGDQLSNAERAEAYRQLAAAPAYRNQRDNAKDPDTTCNFTSQAMAFEALGVEYNEASRGKQAEEQLYDRFYQKGFGSRTNEKDRLKLARDQGLQATQLNTPKFGSGAEAKTWFDAQVAPRLQAGASATMGIANGTFRHVVRVQWVESKGVRVDDPWGEAVGYGQGEFGYSKLNDRGPAKKALGGDQAGLGDDRLIPWDSIATIMSGRYVQIYDAKASQVAARAG